MTSRNTHRHYDYALTLDQPVWYEIHVQGRLESAGLHDWFQGELTCETRPGAARGAVTILIGRLPDQAALHGLLATIRDLGLPLLYLDCLSARQAPQSPATLSDDSTSVSSSLGGNHE